MNIIDLIAKSMSYFMDLEEEMNSSLTMTNNLFSLIQVPIQVLTQIEPSLIC